jgi:hypothetical protein
MPHAPQFDGSVWRSTHLQIVPHTVRPAGHPQAHLPPSQTPCSGHCTPQAPQLLGSFAKSMQLQLPEQ